MPRGVYVFSTVAVTAYTPDLGASLAFLLLFPLLGACEGVRVRIVVTGIIPHVTKKYTEIKTNTKMQNYKFRKSKQILCEELCPGIDARGGAKKSVFFT